MKTDDFACRCDQRHSRRAALALGWAYKFLGDTTRPDNFLTMAVAKLDWSYQASIIWLAFDQWGAISSETWDKSFRTFMQCDHIEDGLAFTLRAYYKKYGPKRLTAGVS